MFSLQKWYVKTIFHLIQREREKVQKHHRTEGGSQAKPEFDNIFIKYSFFICLKQLPFLSIHWKAMYSFYNSKSVRTWWSVEKRSNKNHFLVSHLTTVGTSSWRVSVEALDVHVCWQGTRTPPRLIPGCNCRLWLLCQCLFPCDFT